MGVVVLSLALGACDSTGPTGTDHAFKDEGKICLFPEGTRPDQAFLPPSMSVSYGADRGLVITVNAPECLSGSCDSNRQAACSAVVTGQTIVVTSTASFHREGKTCTLDCGSLTATCTTPPLPAGTYLIQHGTRSLPLTVPSSTVPPCAGQGP
jgi:hypothetical protein